MKKEKKTSNTTAEDLIKNFSEKEIEELSEIFMTQVYEDNQEVKISFDRGQYTIRIPKDFAEAMNINPNSDKFKFSLITSPENFNQKGLSGYLVKMKVDLISGGKNEKS